MNQRAVDEAARSVTLEPPAQPEDLPLRQPQHCRRLRHPDIAHQQSRRTWARCWSLLLIVIVNLIGGD